MGRMWKSVSTRRSQFWPYVAGVIPGIMSGIGTSVLYQSGVFLFNFISPYSGDGGWESLTLFLVKSSVFTDIKCTSLINLIRPSYASMVPHGLHAVAKFL